MQKRYNEEEEIITNEDMADMASTEGDTVKLTLTRDEANVLRGLIDSINDETAEDEEDDKVEESRLPKSVARRQRMSEACTTTKVRMGTNYGKTSLNKLDKEPEEDIIFTEEYKKHVRR